jgi:hypothetical protein
MAMEVHNTLGRDMDLPLRSVLIFSMIDNQKVIYPYLHYNNRGLFCDPNIIANNKERNFRKLAVANHNSSQTFNLLRYHNIRTRTIASPSQLPNLIKSQNFFDYNCFYTLFAINTTSETICNKPIIATT